MTGSAPPDIGTTLGAWAELIRRARIGRERKLACLVFASYGDADGRDIYCGVARLSVDCEIGYSTARRYLAWIRRAGLAEVVKRGSKRKRKADEYRLTFGPDILEHLDVPDPDVYRAMIDAVAETNRVATVKRQARRAASVNGDGTVLRSPEADAEPQQGCGADCADGGGLPPASVPVAETIEDSTDLPLLRSPKRGVKVGPEDEPLTLAQGERKSGFLRSPEPVFTLALGERPPSINHLPVRTTFHKDGEEVRTDLEVPGARGTEDPEISDQRQPPPEPPPLIEPATVCPTHKLPITAGPPDPGGLPRCVFCRRERATPRPHEGTDAA